MKKLLCLMAAAFLSVASFAQADHAKYYIEGDFNITRGSQNQFVYTLSNVTSRGITFDSAKTITGQVEGDESISFTFEKANTDYPGGFGEGLKFWKWQSDGKDYSWQRDSEVKDAQQNFKSDGMMVVMLILDCSTSLGETNFAKLQNAAVKFIDILYNASPNGNVRLGIMGFNTMKNTDKMILDIQPLTAETRNEMLDFIHGLTLYNNTSLYYAMHKGSDLIGTYVSALSQEDREKYDYSCMVSFTDGYDNHSADERIGIPDKGLDNPYFQYVRDNVVNKLVGGKELKSYIIAIKGNDVSEDNKLYQTVFKGLASDEPFLLSDFSQLESQFETMAQELMKRWQNLTCYVPAAYKGKVRWTLGDAKEEKVKAKEPETQKEPENGKVVWGVNANANFEIATKKSVFYPGLGIGFDFSIPLEKLAAGGFVGLKYDIAGPVHISLGPQVVAKNYNKESQKNFIAGLALDLRCNTTTAPGKKNKEEYKWQKDNFGAGVMFRLGMTFPKRVYGTIDFSVGGFSSQLGGPVEGDAPTTDPSADPSDIEIVKSPTRAYFNFAVTIGYRF
jgi:hypothetical protein